MFGTRSTGLVRRVAEGVWMVAFGPGVLASNVYFVRSGSVWVLVDAGWPGHGEAIVAAAESVFGAGTRPAAILLTHLHPDHSGSAVELARRWDLPMYVHREELPLAAGEYVPRYANPLDRWVLAPMLRLLPARTRARMIESGDLTAVVRGLDADGSVPGLPDWRVVPTPGHTPGHVAFHRPGDGVVITGDALLTVNVNSPVTALRRRPRLGGPPRYTTWNWSMARESIRTVAALAPTTIAAGHGQPLTTGTTAAVRAFAQHVAIGPLQGILRPVDYTARTRYRPVPALYRRLQPLGWLLTALGLSPKYVVTLEVPGRRTGVIHRTSHVRVNLDGEQYLVSLAGESQWVRNVRASGGRVVIGRRHRHAAILTELPLADRPPVLDAYLRRAGHDRRPRTGEARHYFGVSPNPSLTELHRIAAYYPVFRIDQTGP